MRSESEVAFASLLSQQHFCKNKSKSVDMRLRVSVVCGIQCRNVCKMRIYIRGPIYKISYDLSYDHRTFIVRPTYHSDLKRAEISLRYIVS